MVPVGCRSSGKSRGKFGRGVPESQERHNGIVLDECIGNKCDPMASKFPFVRVRLVPVTVQGFIVRELSIFVFRDSHLKTRCRSPVPVLPTLYVPREDGVAIGIVESCVRPQT